MGLTDVELLARLIMCEAGGEGDTGMRAVASVIMNRVHASDGEYARISQGGNIRNIIMQECQFTCAKEIINGVYNPQNLFNMTPDDIHYEIADWAINGNRLTEVGESLWFINPYNNNCPANFPYNKTGQFHTRINKHCFFSPTPLYYNT